MLSSITAIVAITAGAVVGAFLGWLIGSSNTPVVSTAIPLVFGLTALLWSKYAALKAQVGAMADASAGGAGSSSQSFDSSASALVNGLIVIAFCAGAYLGVQRGLSERSTAAPPLKELIGQTTISHREAALLAGFRLDLQRMNLGADEIREVFNTVIVPLITSPDYAKGGALEGVRLDALRQAVDEVRAARNTAPRATRGPASEKETPP